MYGIALNTALEQALPNGGGRTLERFCDLLGVLSLAAQLRKTCVLLGRPWCMAQRKLTGGLVQNVVERIHDKMLRGERVKHGSGAGFDQNTDLAAANGSAFFRLTSAMTGSASAAAPQKILSSEKNVDKATVKVIKSPPVLRQYRIIGQERFASKFCVLTRCGFAVILDVLP